MRSAKFTTRSKADKYESDGARRQTGVRRLWRAGSQGGCGEIRERSLENRDRHGLPGRHEDRLAGYSTEIPVAVLGAKYKWARGRSGGRSGIYLPIVRQRGT
jgi:Ligase-CoA domain